MVQGAVRLNFKAQPGGTVVALKSGNANAEVDSYVEVPAGSRYGYFDIFTAQVAATTKVTIFAKRGTKLWQKELTLTPPVANAPKVASVKVEPGEVVAGAEAKVTVTLDKAAPAGGAKVTFASGNPAAKIPAEATVPAGQNAVSVQVTTNKAIAYGETATLTASTNGTKGDAKLVIKPEANTVKSISILGDPGFPGDTMKGFVTLSRNAGPGETVNLTFSVGVAAVAVPIKGEINTGEFAFVLPNADKVTVTAKLGTSEVVKTIAIKAGAVLDSVTPSVAVTEEVEPGQTIELTVKLSAPAEKDLTVAMEGAPAAVFTKGDGTVKVTAKVPAEPGAEFKVEATYGGKSIPLTWKVKAAA